MNYIKEHLQLALDQITHEKEEFICSQDFQTAVVYRNAGDLVRKALKLLPVDLPNIWTEEQCRHLNAGQQDETHHPYTCGNNSNHRPLIATKQGWICYDCDYRQFWSHETGDDKPQ